MALSQKIEKLRQNKDLAERVAKKLSLLYDFDGSWWKEKSFQAFYEFS